MVCCPWDKRENIEEAVDTITANALYGIIHTTWNTLSHGFKSMIYAGSICYGISKGNLDDIYRFYCASVARKAFPSCGEYAKCGWSEKRTELG